MLLDRGIRRSSRASRHEIQPRTDTRDRISPSARFPKLHELEFLRTTAHGRNTDLFVSELTGLRELLNRSASSSSSATPRPAGAAVLLPANVAVGEVGEVVAVIE